MTARKPGEWWTKSWNPVTGCTPIGAGCANCHTMARLKRHLPMLRGKGNAHVPPTQVLCHPERLSIPAEEREQVYLTAMCGDVFHDQVPDEFIRNGVLKTIAGCEYDQMGHRVVLVTKRWKRATEMVRRFANDMSGLPSALLMLSVWDDESALEACRAARGLCIPWGLHCEPLLGPICLSDAVLDAASDWCTWIVAGGETGPGARMTHPDWVRILRDDCGELELPFYFKGWGAWSWLPYYLPEEGLPDCYRGADEAELEDFRGRVLNGKHRLMTPDGRWAWQPEVDGQPPPETLIFWKQKGGGGRLLDGVEHNATPWSRA